MKYSDEYRDKDKCAKVAAMVNAAARERRYNIMEVCGTHTAAIRRFGIKEMISRNINLISGPGCPVCVTSDGYLKNAFCLAKNKKNILATYPDMIRVPAHGTSLEEERARGADVRGVVSALDAVSLAGENSSRDVIFLGVGFETTAPGTALALMRAQREKLKNFFIYSGHKTIPEALAVLGAQKDVRINGFLLPGHVSAVIGVHAYSSILKKTKTPSVVCGFEALDILVSLYVIVKAVNAGAFILENEYSRIVRKAGNVKARALLDSVFQKEDAVWRGLGVIKGSGLSLRKKYRAWDASKKFALAQEAAVSAGSTGCRCAEVLRGKIKPTGCPLFGKKCLPRSPLGACMVSREGACRTYYEYR
jgi:hydrogenase expression/formation protein HypD